MPSSPQKILYINKFSEPLTSFCLWIKGNCKTRLQYVWFRHKTSTFSFALFPRFLCWSSRRHLAVITWLPARGQSFTWQKAHMRMVVTINFPTTSPIFPPMYSVYTYMYSYTDTENHFGSLISITKGSHIRSSQQWNFIRGEFAESFCVRSCTIGSYFTCCCS